MKLPNIKLDLSLLIIPAALIVAYFIYYQLLGQPQNFIEGDPTREPINGNILGVIYKGGPIVIFLISFQLLMVVYVIDRFLAIGFSHGKGDISQFVHEVKAELGKGNLSKIEELCDRQEGAVANVVKTGLGTFLSRNKIEKVDQRDIYLIQKEMEETTQLELPLLNRNMFILATIAQISTLVGLLGTVTGMIKAFGALANVGEPDPVGLAGGISQALVTTAMGIGTAAVTIVFYNYFANQIDRITYGIDEASFSIIHTLKLKFFQK